MKKYIGKNIRTGEWVTSDNVLIDSKNNDTYLIPNLFSMDELPLDKRKLFSYKVDRHSFGWAVAKDINKETLFCGDEVEIEYYIKTARIQEKSLIRAIVCYDTNMKIHYMLAGKKIFMFRGDSQHIISSIKRVGRSDNTVFITANQQ